VVCNLLLQADCGGPVPHLSRRLPRHTGIRAPLIIRYPAAVPAGVRTGTFAYVTDVVPTLLEFAGVDASEKAAAVLAGRSMVPLLTARADHVHAPG
jgi:arylsulfatase A-like enzyme